mmetsp:Transcript_23377/g.44579  ORF Transcript_23377/g.44579 Transcript_23377/m.44579 type:complete len:251 (-) Transcript_23377:565-1317(-)
MQQLQLLLCHHPAQRGQLRGAVQRSLGPGVLLVSLSLSPPLQALGHRRRLRRRLRQREPGQVFLLHVLNGDSHVLGHPRPRLYLGLELDHCAAQVEVLDAVRLRAAIHAEEEVRRLLAHAVLQLKGPRVQHQRAHGVVLDVGHQEAEAGLHPALPLDVVFHAPGGHLHQDVVFVRAEKGKWPKQGGPVRRGAAGYEELGNNFVRGLELLVHQRPRRGRDVVRGVHRRVCGSDDGHQVHVVAWVLPPHLET